MDQLPASHPAPEDSSEALLRRLAAAEAELAAAREREYYYQALLSSSSEGIWRFELREPVDTAAPAAEQIASFYACGVLAECNQALARMYGFAEPGEILGRPLRDFLIEADPANTAYLESFISAGYRLVDALSHETDRYGAQRYFLNGLVGIIKQGRLLGAWGYQRDITALHLARQEQERLAAEARQALLARDEFLSISAHELRNPLTSLAGYGQLLQRRLSRAGGLDPADARALGIMITQATRLQRMIGAMQDLSQLQNGQLALNLAPVDLAALAQAVADELQPLHDNHQLLVRRPAEPLLVRGDDMRLEQVVYNLLNNAIKYSPRGGPIAIELRRAGAAAELSVSDAGIGIAAGAQAAIFELFARAPTEGPAIDGMGVGLYVVREVVRLHGGQVAVRSAPGAGSCFTISLPLPA